MGTITPRKAIITEIVMEALIIPLTLTTEAGGMGAITRDIIITGALLKQTGTRGRIILTTGTEETEGLIMDTTIRGHLIMQRVTEGLTTLIMGVEDTEEIIRETTITEELTIQRVIDNPTIPLTEAGIIEAVLTVIILVTFTHNTMHNAPLDPLSIMVGGQEIITNIPAIMRLTQHTGSTPDKVTRLSKDVIDRGIITIMIVTTVA
ncbi:hypothetical protein M408DRAFT_24703 [Serendipita vermifera MAFF 305830]|uniref:Uncharacterized protein n=1 Tax=Serendipita vermifera MAFF 305830 TaxID=933852 RepID=A0A0C2XDR9_SERVB|nr:hypothetical protein M408DRAFT_24703 [Serendipita vermifera MAFF 305830]